MKFRIHKSEPPREFGAWKKILDETTEIPGETFDMEAAWSVVRARLHDQPQARTIRPFIFQNYSAAATAIIFIMLFFTLEKPNEGPLIGKQPANEVKQNGIVKSGQETTVPLDSNTTAPLNTIVQPTLASGQNKSINHKNSQVNPPAKDDSLGLAQKDPEPVIKTIDPDPVPIEPIPLATVKKEIPDVHIGQLSKKESNSPMARSNLGRRMLKHAGEASVKAPVEETSERVLIP